MNSYIIDISVSKDQDISKYVNDPKFRNASKNIFYSCACIDILLKNNSEFLNFIKTNNVGLFVATSHGELNNTCEFLKFIATTDTARPIYFQNSLHNSILGFLTLYFGLNGPAFSVSNHHFSVEDALELADSMLEADAIDYALVIGVDTIPTSIKDLFVNMYESNIVNCVLEGAGAVFLSKKHNLEKIKKHYSKDKILKIKSILKEDAELEKQDSYYDTNLIEKLYSSINKNELEFEILKPIFKKTKVVLEEELF